MEKIGIKSAKIHHQEKEQSLTSLVHLQEIAKNQFIFGFIRFDGRKNTQREHILSIIETHLNLLSEVILEKNHVARKFEQFLQQVNTDIATYTDKNFSVPISDFHAVIGVIHENQIYLSGTGKQAVIFMHQSAPSRYVIYELDKQFVSHETLWKKPFEHVLDGELEAGDVFYMAHRLPQREISLDNLQEILITLPPAGALKRIQQHAGAHHHYEGISFRVMEKVERQEPVRENPLHSIEKLGQTRETTAELLGEQSPDITGSISKYSHKIFAFLSAPGEKGLKKNILYVSRLSLRGVLSLNTLLASLYRNIKTKLTRFYQLINPQASVKKAQKELEQKKREANTPKPVIEGEKRASFMQRLFYSLSNLSLTSKVVATASLFVFVILISSLTFLNSQSTQKESEEVFSTITKRIEEKKDAAEAALIYDNTEQAKTLLTEASALLETLPVTSDVETNTIKRLREEINMVFYTIRGITEPEITELAVLENNRIQSVVEANGLIYLMGENKLMYRLKMLDTPGLEEIPLTSEYTENILAATGEGSNILAVGSNKTLYRIDTTSNTQKAVTSGVEQLTDVTDLTLYNGSLYVIDEGTNQIIKMRPQGDGFEAGTDWITSTLTNIENMHSIAVDGDIYTLTDKTIKRFNSGRELAYTVEAVDPVMQNPKELWTTVDTPYLYVLEPNEGRVIVFNKDGSFENQYISESFKGAVGMVIKEEERKIIIVTPQHVLQFNAEHLM